MSTFLLIGLVPLALSYYKDYILPVVHPPASKEPYTEKAEYDYIGDQGSHYQTPASDFLMRNTGLPGAIPSMENGTHSDIPFLTHPFGIDLVAEAATPCQRAKENSCRAAGRPRMRDPYSYITRAVPTLQMRTITPITHGSSVTREPEKLWL